MGSTGLTGVSMFRRDHMLTRLCRESMAPTAQLTLPPPRFRPKEVCFEICTLFREIKES